MAAGDQIRVRAPDYLGLHGQEVVLEPIPWADAPTYSLEFVAIVARRVYIAAASPAEARAALARQCDSRSEGLRCQLPAGHMSTLKLGEAQTHENRTPVTWSR